jgi:hypothetical protein
MTEMPIHRMRRSAAALGGGAAYDRPTTGY